MQRRARRSRAARDLGESALKRAVAALTAPIGAILLLSLAVVTADMVALDVQGIGSFPITLDAANAPKAVAILQSFAAGSNAVEIHRAEPQPPAGSNGPPYALVQFTLPKSGLSKHQHEGSAKIRRGSVCLIGGADDIFVSLARSNEHDGWEVSMTIVGTMSDPALAEFEDKILALPKHDFVHPNYGTKMSMLNDKVPATLKLDDREL